MHTQPVLQKFFRASLPEVHPTRAQALIAAVDAVARGARVSITCLGRSLGPTRMRIKHRVKRMDRLIGNGLLGAQRKAFYHAIISRLLADCPQPIILIDWSDFRADRQQQLLRASLAVGSRAITLFEELHPYCKWGNRQVQHRFLNQLRTMVPATLHTHPYRRRGFSGAVLPAGGNLGLALAVAYSQPRLCAVARRILRLDQRQVITRHRQPPCARPRGRAVGAQAHPLAGRLALILQNLRGRKDRSLTGMARRSALSRKHAKRTREPWRLIASHSLQNLSTKQLVRLYKTRMQIEEGFRDTQSVAYGLGVATGRHTTFERAANLLLIAALVSFISPS